MSESSRTSETRDSGGAALENGVFSPTPRPDLEAKNELDLIGTLLVLTHSKKPILQITVAAALLAALVSLLLPPMYTAETTILPPQQTQSPLGSIVGQLGALGGLSASDLGLQNPADLFVAVLQSRTIADHLIERFDLRKVYWVKRYQDARKKLESRSNISAGDQGLIRISVSDRDPRRAADLANAYVDELHDLNQHLAISEAAQRRLFYQQKLDAERDELSQAEMALRQTQEKSGLIQPDAQGKAIIEALANARAQVAVKEVQLQAMRTYATEDNPDVKRAERELAALRGQLAKLERNTGEFGNGNLEVPTRRLPEAELEYIRRSRDLKYHETFYEFLAKELESARLDEARDAIFVQVVDKAVVPEKKSSPKRLLITAISAFTALALACLGVLFLEVLRRKQEEPRERARLQLLWESLRSSSRNP